MPPDAAPYAPGARRRCRQLAEEVRISLAGRVALSTGWAAADEAALGPLGRLALAYLVLERHRPVPRDELADALWGEALPATWDASLRSLLSRLRAFFEAGGLPGAGVLTTSHGCVEVDLPEATVVDVEDAASALGAAESALAAGEPARAVERASHAAGIAGRQFLPGAGGAWAERRQAELAELRLRSEETLSAAASAAGDTAGAVAAAERAVALQPFRESAYLRLMAAHAAAGNRGEALRAYERCRKALAEELGVDPSPRTEQAYLDLLRQEAPPAPPPAADRPPVAGCRLPAQLTGFLGRRAELDEVVALSRACRVLTLTGMGGVGKTRLALETAARLLDDHPDGVWFVELAPLADSDLVVPRVLQELGVVEQEADGPLGSLTQALAGRRALLVLDNCEHLVWACASLVDALLRCCADVRVLATSREALGVPGETAWPVPPLPAPPAADVAGDVSVDALAGYEAVQLFVERARSASPGFALTPAAAPLVAEICHRLDGVPLAIELAAARVRSMSLEEIVRRLEDRFRLLTGGARTAAPRHQTLRATLDWSWQALGDAERSVFEALSVFAGGFTLGAAESVCAGGPHERDRMADALRVLVDRSLVVADTGQPAMRYRVLETLRQYGAEKLAVTGAEAAVRARHLAWSADLAEGAEAMMDGPGQQQAVDRLEAERDNLRAALTWGTAEPGRVDALRLAAALWRFWEMQAVREGRTWLDAALASNADAPDALRAKALNSAAVLAQAQRHHAEARAYYEESLVLRDALGDRLGCIAVRNGLAGLLAMGDDLPTAKRLFEDNLRDGRELGDLRVVAASLNNLGTLLQMYQMAELVAPETVATEGRAHFEQALDAYRRLGDDRGAAIVLENLSNLHRFAGDLGLARSVQEESLAIRRRLGDKTGIAMSLRLLGLLAMSQDDVGTAERVYRESYELHREVGNAREMSMQLVFLADAARRRGDLAEALRHLEESLAIQREAGDVYGTKRVLGALGNVLCRRRDLARAREVLEEGAALGRRLGGADLVHGLAALAALARAEGDHGRVVELWREAAAVADPGRHPGLVRWFLELLGSAAVAAGDLHRGAALFGASRGGDRIPDEDDEAPEYHADLAALRRGLGQEELARAWAQGAALDPAQAVGTLASGLRSNETR